MRYQILFLSSWYPTKRHTTRGNFVQRHAEAVSILHNVEVLHAIGDEKQKQHYLFDEKNVNNVRTLIVYYKKTKFPVLNFYRRMRAHWKGFQRMTKPDLIHANVMYNTMLFAPLLKFRYNIRYVVTEHWTTLLHINHFKLSGLSKFFVKYIAKNAEIVMPVSESLQQGLTNLGIQKQMRVIGNVVNCELFQLTDANPQPTIKFLHISSLKAIKNADKIIETAIRLYTTNPNFELHIGGDGDIEPLQKLIKKHRAESYIKLFGTISHKEVAQKMQNTNCFILYSDYETQGCVVLEAFATGKPVITTNVEGVRDIIDESRAIIIEKQNQEELLCAMKSVVEKTTLFTTPEKMRNFVVENFSREKIAKQYSDIYLSILNE